MLSCERHTKANRIGSGLLARILVTCLCGFFTTLAMAGVDIKIEGATTALEKNIRSHLGEISETTLTKPKTLRREIKEAVTAASKGLGYYHATETHEVDGKKLTIKVARGLRTHIVNSNVHVIGPGAGERWFEKLMEDTGLSFGRSLNHGNYQTLKKKLRQTAQRHGYFDAVFEQQKILVDRETDTAEVHLIFNTGPRYQFGEFVITGTELKPAVIRNLASFEPGDPYDSSKLTKFNRNLLESRYFDDVRLNVEPNKKSGNSVPVEVKLRDVSDHKFGVGAGYGTDTGPRLKFTWDRFLVNERGDSFGVITQFAQISQSISAHYRFAGKKALTDYFEIQGGWQHEIVEDKDDTLTNLGFYVQRQSPSLWTRGLFVKLQNESWTQGEETGASTYVIPGVSFSRTRSRGTLDPVWGDYLWTDVQYSDPGLGSDTAFIRWTGGFKYLRRLEELHQVQFRAELGNLQSGDFEKVPASMRFFAGGDHSIRGYDYQSLSPKDDKGQSTGGRFLQIGSAEYSYKILDQWRLATFVDTGRAFDHDSDPFYTGIGLGLRWLSPVGIVSIDLAHPEKGSNRDFRIHFYMGPPL